MRTGDGLPSSREAGGPGEEAVDREGLSALGTRGCVSAFLGVTVQGWETLHQRGGLFHIVPSKTFEVAYKYTSIYIIIILIHS